MRKKHYNIRENHPRWKGKKAVNRQKRYCIELGCNNKISYMNWKYGNKRCQICASREKWQNKEYKEKNGRAILKGLNLSPNKPEKQLNKILNQLLPKEYKFVGDGKVFIAGFVPDFINVNGQKKIIELYGDYWHNREDAKKRDKNRIKTYINYGYKTLIIWDKELKDIDKLKNKILLFNENFK